MYKQNNNDGIELQQDIPVPRAAPPINPPELPPIRRSNPVIIMRFEPPNLAELPERPAGPVPHPRRIQNRNYNSAEDYMTAFDIKMYAPNCNEYRQEECSF